MSWQPSLGAWPVGQGTQFRVWAPEAQTVEVVLESPQAGGVHRLERAADGTFAALLPDLGDGALYRYRVDGQGPYPDPASRFQPEGVHGPSQVVDPHRFPWSDTAWQGIALEELVIYELHVGTFTAEGTFRGVTDRLPLLKQLGVTAIELMPVADFPGQRNWGYDGVDLFAPARCYGRPDDLRRLVDQAHQLGLAVLLDVVYNHLGPDGNYLSSFSPYYFSTRHQSAWGAGLNFDGPSSQPVRDFFIENAQYWIHHYHMDGLRLDATHAIEDESPRHFLAELTDRVRSAAPRPVLLIAEDHRNLAHMVRPADQAGWGLDAVWADDFHHQVRRHLAGDQEGYYRDFSGSAEDMATTIRKGWFFCGQYSEHLQEPRGTDPTGIPPRRFVHCIQNHDQIGNRALGERLHHQVEPAAYRAASALLLGSPATPLLFMGQEWAASSPFLFFTDHNDELGQQVTAGRRREFQYFSAFSDPEARQRIPDPQDPTTWLNSRLQWPERERPEHATTLALYQALLRLRQSEPALRAAGLDSFSVTVLGDETLLLVRRPEAGQRGPSLLLLVHLRGAARIGLAGQPAIEPGLRWELLLSTEQPPYSPDPMPPQIELSGPAPTVHFPRPAAVLLRQIGLEVAAE